MRTPIPWPAAFLAALLLAPVAQAGWLSEEPLSITIPHYRAGDKLLYRASAASAQPSEGAQTHAQAPTGGSTSATSSSATMGAAYAPPQDTVVLVEGAGRAADRFGIERDVETFRVQNAEDDRVLSDLRCHQLRGGRDAVRVDVIEGQSFGFGWEAGDDLLLGREAHVVDLSLVAYYGGSCPVANALGGRTFREGDTLLLEDVLPGAGLEVASLPARASTFEGRPALVFSFAPEGGPSGYAPERIDVTLAEGLPGWARARTVPHHGSERGEHEIALAGIERGQGAPLAPRGEARLPERNPQARFAAPRPLALDDAAYALPFPYAAAYATLQDDPQRRFALWLDAHPDAFLVQASVGEGEAQPATFAPTTEGDWFLQFQDGDQAFRAFVQRTTGFATPAGSVAAPAPVAMVAWAEAFTLTPEEALAEPPGTLADSASLLRVARAAGLGPDPVRSMSYFLAPGPDGKTLPHVVFSTRERAGDDSQGRTVSLDPVAGGAMALMEVRSEVHRDGGLLAPPAQSSLAASGRGSALSVLAGPGVGAGLAVGGAAAATGLALLVVLVKLVAVPLFTRLRRDRLLDNPVRARLFERVRSDPGIHLAELEEFTGLGHGATRHHLDQLVKHRFVVRVEEEGFTRFFAAGEVPREAARRAALLRAGRAREVYDLYSAHPGLPLREAAARLGVSAPSVHRVKKRLEKEGLLPAAAEAEVRAARA